MISRKLVVLIICIAFTSCSKRENKRHRCFPNCTEITIAGTVIDTINNQIAAVPFDVYFVHIPSAWISVFPVKDKLICSSLSDENGKINETFTCDYRKLNDDYVVEISFEKKSSSHAFYIDSVPDETILFNYYVH